MRVDRCALAALVFALCVSPVAASADAGGDTESRVSVALGGHITSALSQVCDGGGDVIGCRTFLPFAGADLAGHYVFSSFIRAGLRFAGSKDLDAAQTASSLGESTERDQLLWRALVTGELDPPGFPERLYLSVELGAALLHDSFEEFAADGRRLRDLAVDQWGAVAGLGLGWDIPLGAGVAIGFTLRGQVIALPSDPPRLADDLLSLEVGTATWLELGVRFVVTD